MEKNKPRRAVKKSGRSKREAIFIRRRIVLLLSIFLIFFFVIRGIISVVSSNLPTVTVIEEVYRDEAIADSFIIKSEHIQKVSNENLKFKAKDGEKVAKGEVIATARVLPTEDQKNELSDLARKIDIYEAFFENYKYYLGNENVKEEDVSEYIKELKTELGEKEADKADKVMSDILAKNNNSASFFEDKIKAFKKSRDKVIKESGMGSKEYKAEIPGLFSQHIDGYEDKFTLKNVEKLDFELFNSLSGSFKGNETINQSSSAYRSIKIIDNTTWRAFIKLKIDYKRYLDGRSYVNFSIPNTDISLLGRVVDSKEDEREMLLLLEFNERLHDIYDKRYVKAKIEKDTYEGLKVPNSSLVDRNGTMGVYVKDISGIVRFCPISIKYRDKEYAIVKKEESATTRATLDGKVQDFKTLKIYDEVMKYGSLAKENSIIN